MFCYREVALDVRISSLQDFVVSAMLLVIVVVIDCVVGWIYF